METSPSAIAFRGIRNVDMIPFIRDVIDTLREFDLRRLGSSRVYKTRMETELQPHLVPHWVQPLQKPPYTPFFHTRIQKWKRHNMMRVLEAAADEIAGNDIKIAELTDTLRRRVEPMAPHLQAAVDSFIQRLRLNRAGAEQAPLSGEQEERKAFSGAVKAETDLPAKVTTEEFNSRGLAAKLDDPAGVKKMDWLSCSPSSLLGLKRTAPEVESSDRGHAKKLCLWDLPSSRSKDSQTSLDTLRKCLAQLNAQKGVSKPQAKPPTYCSLEGSAVDTSTLLAFLKPLLPTPSSVTPNVESSIRSPGAAPPKHFDLKQQYDLLAFLDEACPETSDPSLQNKQNKSVSQDDDLSESFSSQAAPDAETCNSDCERVADSEEERSLEDLDFDEYQEAVFMATSSRAGDGLEKELLQDSRQLLQGILSQGECMHVGALRIILIAEKLLAVVEHLQQRSSEWESLSEEEMHALERLSSLLPSAKDRVQNAHKDDPVDILAEIDTNKTFQQEAARLDRLADIFLPAGSSLLEEPRLQLRLASAHNRLAVALSQHGWVEEAQEEMGKANTLLAKLQAESRDSSKRALSPPPECPISMERMEDPVVLTTGHTFERSAIKRWFRAGNTTCPITRQPLTDLELVSNEALKGYSARWHAANGLALPQAPMWPEISQTISKQNAYETEKGGDLFQVDDFLSEALRETTCSPRSFTKGFDVGGALTGKSGVEYSPEDDFGFSQHGEWQGLRDLEIMEWA